jgi:hypothetical protein
MSRRAVILKQASTIISSGYSHKETELALGRAYDAGHISGSGQSSITPLEREVLTAALEWLRSSPVVEHAADAALISATQELSAALEREATE